MAAWTLSSACSCMTLRTSSFIIAYINLIVYVTFSTIMLLEIADLDNIANNSDEREVRSLAENTIVLAWIWLMIFLKRILYVVVLLVGLHKMKRNLVRASLIMVAFHFLLVFSMVLVGLVGGSSAETVGIRVTVLCLEAYSFLVVRSYYYEMEPTHVNA